MIPSESENLAAFSRAVIVRGNLDHEVHHRGQIAAYLRVAGMGEAP